jgi:prophage DNA circulation protein
MSWKDRLRLFITLISPEGNIFFARWRGDDITLQKRVNRVAHPDQDGESSQDLGLNSPDVPLTFYFDGLNHDTEALRFSRAIAERGAWQVTHPVYGFFSLQPVKITIRAQPVESGNVTEISGDWFVSDLSVEGRPPFASSDPVKRAVSALKKSAQDDASRMSFFAALAAAMQSAAQQFRKGVDAVKGVLHSANARVTAIMGTINDLSLQPYLDVAALSGAVIQLAESPGLVLGQISNRVSMFVKLGNRIITDLPAAMDFSRDKIAVALTGELWINSALIGMGTTVTQSLPETRAEAISALHQFRDFSAKATAALDALAKASAANPIENQYFPRAASAEAVLTLNAAVSRYILGVAFDLKTEKRITLARPTSPMLLAIQEYNCPAAEADYYFDLLCRSNNLHGRELLLLDRGREIVIYS